LPESAEIKLSVDLIRPLIKDQLIIDAYPTNGGRYDNDNLPSGYTLFKDSFKNGNCYVEDIKAKGKFVYFLFTNGQIMFNTFGMSGQWGSKSKHPCFCFHYTPSLSKITEYKELYFNDPRHFGTIKFTNDKQQLNKKLNELGWDILSEDLAPYQNKLITSVQRSKKCIGTLLLDQKLYSGCGNYLRAEALYLSEISPWRLGSSLSKDEILNICHNLTRVATNAYNYQGASFSTFSSPSGQKGKYSKNFLIYKQSTDPHGNPIKRETTPEGRTIHWSPAIQK
jgi:DNA-formamidopyrimidine glycosylase